MNNDTVFRGFVDFGDNNSAFRAVALMIGKELVEGVVADDIGVEHEEWGVILCKNLLSELQRTSSVERLRLDRELDFDVVLFLVL